MKIPEGPFSQALKAFSAGWLKMTTRWYGYSQCISVKAVGWATQAMEQNRDSVLRS